jgi:enamine deaminase RidA (YjgF/YER057c/UK114 family)
MTMTIRKISSPAVAEPPAPFSQCLVVGNQVFLSGMTAEGPDHQPQGGEDMKAQTLACFAKVRHMLEAAGSGLADVVKLTLYTTDISRRAEISAARREVLAEPWPCSTLVEVRALAAPGLLIEVDAVAIIGASGR